MILFFQFQILNILEPVYKYTFRLCFWSRIAFITLITTATSLPKGLLNYSEIFADS